MEKELSTLLSALSALSLSENFILSPDQEEEPKTTVLTRLLVGMIAEGCQALLSKQLKPKMIPEDSSFFAFEQGLDVEGEKPDFVLTLGQKKGKFKIPCVVIHEKISLEHFDESLPQLAEYVIKLFEEKIEFGNQKFTFEKVYILLVFKETGQFKLIEYKRPGKETKTLEDCVGWSDNFCLLEKETKNVDQESLKTVMRVLLKVAYVQLKSLKLVA